MTFTETLGNRTFAGRMGRKLLAPIQITLSGPPDTDQQCVLHVSVDAAVGPFGVQEVPTQWLPENGTTVKSPPFPPNAPPVFTAYASFFDATSLSSSKSFSQSYSCQVIDSTMKVVFSFGFSVCVNALPALNKSVVFVLDRTQTMSTTSTSAGSATFLDRLKAAVPRGLGLFTGADSVGVVTLDHGAGDVRVPLGLGSTTIPSAKSVIATLSVAGGFGVKKVFQTGIDLGRAQSSTATVLLVTDGALLPPTGFPTAPQLSPASVLFVGDSAPTSADALNNLRSTDGVYAISAPNTGEFAVEKLLSQILIDLGGGSVVSDPDGSLGHDQSLSFPITLNETDRELELIVFSDHAEWLQIHPGAGLDRDPKAEADGCDKDGHDYKECTDKEPHAGKNGVLVSRVRLSPDEAHHGADHNITVSRSDRGPRDIRATFSFLAAVQSDLLLDASATASGFEVGADVLLSARLTEYGLPIEKRAGTLVEVELRHPDGGVEKVDLRECSPGHFQASRRAFRAGIYTVHFIATGRTWLKELPFRREALRTVVVFELGASGCYCGSRPAINPILAV